MKRLQLLQILFIFFYIHQTFVIQAQSIRLPEQWKFIMDDNEAYKDPSFNDKDWQTIAAPMAWEKLGLNRERSIGWYRVAISVAPKLLNQEVVLYAGIIDDADETYFNGHFVGRTGKFPPNDQSAWDVQRQYLIKKEWIQKNNVIAIRVYNGAGGGGINGGRFELLSKTESDRQIARQIKSKKSYYQLTTSNGLTASVYNEQTNEIENWYPHIFSYYDSGLAVKPVLSHLRLNKSVKPVSVSYLQNTHIIKVKYPSFSLYYFTSFTRQDKILYVIAKGNEQSIRNLDFTFHEESGKISLVKSTIKNGANAEKYFLFGFADTLHKLPNLQIALNNLKQENLLAKEQQFMQNIFTAAKIPQAVTPAERNVIQQGIAILKMSQVSDKEIFPVSHGQVLASLRPGVWAIAWVRDAAFAIESMSKLGMYKEAKRALQFMLTASPTNQYIHYIYKDGKDYGIGVPYIISVTRYFGNGREESDYNENGPNIEIDDFGLFLTAFYYYINESGDRDFFENNEEAIHIIGKAILHNINDKNIIRRDSGPWEHHLPGKEFIWTSGVCARGLQLIATLQKRFNHPYREFEEGALRLYKGIREAALIENRYIKGNATEQNPTDHHYFDGATFELFANGLINDKKLFTSHMREYNKHNRISNDPEKGYCRFNSSDSYENQEWPFAGLRVAVAQVKLGNRKEAKKLIDRITAFASRNNNQVPEILSNEMGLYRGAIPMVGYGSAAYILALIKYYNR